MVLVIAGYLTFKVYEHRFEQARFPTRIAVTGTIYKLKENWGIGPGGNETGVIIYGLDEIVSKRLEHEGPSLGDNQSIRAAVGSDNHDYYEWRRTPIDTSGDQWSGNDQFYGSRHASPIVRYLDKYGFGIAVSPSIARQIDDTLSHAGAYYAYGYGGSLIVIAPEEKRVIFAYAG